MQTTKLNITVIIILTSVLSSCSILKKAEKNNPEENESKFIYLFSEANKNRLLGNNKTAIEQYLSAIDIKPTSAASNFYLSTIFILEKKYETALKFAEKAVDLQPENFWYNLAKADILTTLNKTKSAVNIYENLIKSNTKSEILYDRLIRIYFSEKDLTNLSKIYERKLEHIEFDNKTALSLYELCIKSRNTNKAEKILKEIILHNSDDPKYKALLAELYVSTHESDKAEILYRELLIEYPENNNVILSYAYYCKYTNKTEEYYNNVMWLMGSDLNIITKINLLISGQYPNFPKDKYLKLLKELYIYHPNEIAVNTLYAEYYIDDDNKEEALNYVRKATELSNSNFNLLLILFELSYDEGKFEDLYNDSEKYLHIFPNRPKVFLYNGIAAYEIKKYDKAIFVLETGMDLVIEDNELLVQFYYYLAESFQKVENNNKSDQYFEKILLIDSCFYSAIISYSIHLSKREVDIEKAELLAKRCIESDKTNPVYYYAYSLSLLKGKKYSESLKVSEKYVNKTSKNTKYLELHGDILFSAGKKKEALEYWNLSKNNGRTDEHLFYKIINVDKLKLSEL
ncbi:MAG: tetratricopeptide repeat protein [Bacteroidales bacterium]|nr:tetratricopeptide repeat protein [Bacteroidales bacterium]